MTEVELLIIWLLSLFIGGLIGRAKGQETSGLIWPIFLGPIGVIVVVCLPNLVKEAAAREEKDRQLKLIALQEAQLRELRALRAAEPTLTPPSPPSRDAGLDEFVPENLRSPSPRRS
jgi:hypothetical protein